jgi:SanA protein
MAENRTFHSYTIDFFMFKKLAIVGYFLLLGFFLLGIIYYDEIGVFFSRAADGHVLTYFFTQVGSYFEHAEAWNIIMLVFFIFTSLALWILIDLGIHSLSKRIARKINFVQNLSAEKPKIFRIIKFVYSISAQKAVSATMLIFIIVVGSNIFVILYGSSHSLDNYSKIPGKQPVLVLGTAKTLQPSGKPNLYFTYRIETAVDLYKHGKVSYFILSGDGGQSKDDQYDELRDMTNDLVAQGVSIDSIKTDTAGYRTIDSMLRIREFFKTKNLVVVSQAFHTPRAVLAGNYYGMRCLAVNARGDATFTMFLREIRSKTGIMTDLLFANMQPRAGKSNVSYREDFEFKNDQYIWFVIFLIGFSLSVLGLVFKYLDRLAY